MQRRTLLCGLVTLAAGATAGCAGANREVPPTAPDPPPELRDADDGSTGGPSDDGDDGDDSGGGDRDTPEGQRFIVPDRRFRADEDGDLSVVVTVANRVEMRHEAVMTVRVAAGSKTFTVSRYVSLGPTDQRAVEVGVPVAFDEFEQSPGFEVSFEPGTPATPIPEGTVTPYPDDRDTATGDDTGETATDSVS